MQDRLLRPYGSPLSHAARPDRGERVARRRQRLAQAAAMPLPDVGYCTAIDLLARLKVCDATLRRWIEEGRVPPPVQLSPRIRAWPVHQVRQILATIASSGGGR